MAADKAFRASAVFLPSTACRTLLAWVFKADLIEALRSLFFSFCRALFRAETWVAKEPPHKKGIMFYLRMKKAESQVFFMAPFPRETPNPKFPAGCPFPDLKFQNLHPGAGELGLGGCMGIGCLGMGL
jgi:hypothetical protein